MHFNHTLLKQTSPAWQDNKDHLLKCVKKKTFDHLGLPLSAWDKYTEHPLASRLASYRPDAHFKALLRTLSIYYTPDAFNNSVRTCFFHVVSILSGFISKWKEWHLSLIIIKWLFRVNCFNLQSILEILYGVFFEMNSSVCHVSNAENTSL